MGCSAVDLAATPGRPSLRRSSARETDLRVAMANSRDANMHCGLDTLALTNGLPGEHPQASPHHRPDTHLLVNPLRPDQTP